MTTLVLSIDRGTDLHRDLDVEYPVVGWEALEKLVLDLGLADPEDTTVNRHLEALSVTLDLRNEGETTIVAAVSGSGETAVGGDRAVARQIDQLVRQHDPSGVIIVVDSAEDERLVPVIESRIRVDSVDRVVVRQAHDLESTYYLLKQFLADEELRTTVLVPIGITLVVFPVLSVIAGIAVAFAAIAAVIGGFLLYKGLGIDESLEDLPVQARDAFYSGRVSIVMYAVGAGLALVGLFAGALGVSGVAADPGLPGSESVVVPVMAFTYHSVPWVALAAMTAGTGRLLDEFLRAQQLPNAYLNLPFGILALGVVIRGFSAYFLQRSGAIPALRIPNLQLGPLSITSFPLTPEERLAVFVVFGVLVSLIGVRVAAYLSGTTIPDREFAD